MGRMALLLLACAMPACRTRLSGGAPRDWYAGGGFSAVPQVGLTGGFGKVVKRTQTSDWAAELYAAFQFLDDKDFADDERPGADDVTQIRAGLKHIFSPGHKRHLTIRYGAVWFRADGEHPLIIEGPGDYTGAYLAIGFETDLSARWTLGPEFALLLVDGSGDNGFEAVPQFTWHLIYSF